MAKLDERLEGLTSGTEMRNQLRFLQEKSFLEREVTYSDIGNTLCIILVIAPCVLLLIYYCHKRRHHQQQLAIWRKKRHQDWLALQPKYAEESHQ